MLVEFLEFLGRAAVIKFSGNCDECEEEPAPEEDVSPTAKAHEADEFAKLMKTEQTPLVFMPDVDG